MPIFHNYATLSYNGQTAISNLVTGEIVASLRMTKTAVVDTYAPDGQITYAVSIVNAGGGDLTDLELSDDLGAYAFGGEMLTPLRYAAGSAHCFVNGVQQDGLTVTAGPPLSITGIRVPASGSALILYTAEVTAYAPMCSGGQIENTATLSGTGITEPLTASASVTPECSAELNITKTLSPLTVTESGEITYTFMITNLGGQATRSIDNAVVSDTFDPVIHDISVTLDGQSLTADQYSYDALGGAFATSPGVITVPAAEFAQDPENGIWSRSPGMTVLQITGKV